MTAPVPSGRRRCRPAVRTPPTPLANTGGRAGNARGARPAAQDRERRGQARITDNDKAQQWRPGSGSSGTDPMGSVTQVPACTSPRLVAPGSRDARFSLLASRPGSATWMRVRWGRPTPARPPPAGGRGP
eukprot:gene12991-biopygen1956